MNLKQIIGENLKNYRLKLGLTQDQVAEFLEVDRSMISLFENAEREISMIHLSKYSNLFGVDIEDILEEDSILRQANMAFAFRSNGIINEDLKSIADFQKVVKNYITMIGLANEERETTSSRN